MRGRKALSNQSSNNWEDIFWDNLPTYIGILNNFFSKNNYEFVEIGNCLDKLSFTIPKGLNSKEIHLSGKHQVISQSKEYTIGYTDRTDLLVDKDLPLIIFGDHSKTIKYVDEPFVIGADGVKLIKPKSSFNERFFYYFTYGIITDTKDYGRHFSLLRRGLIAKVEDLTMQIKVVEFLDSIKSELYSSKQVFFNESVEKEIYKLQENKLKGILITSELTHQLSLVKKLRQSFLQEAVQGKLLAQNPADEPASELLKKIKAEKEKLIAEKKLKKEKALPPIQVEEIPFKIPEGWVWCRLGEICNYGSSPKAEPYSLNDNTWVLDLEDIEKETSNLLCKIRFNERNSLSTKSKFRKGDVLYSKLRPYLDKVIVADEDGVCTTEILPLRLYGNLNPYYIRFTLKRIDFLKYVNSVTKGMKMPRLGTTEGQISLIPLPPLSEQIRIVQKLDELMQTCDELEASIKESQAQNEKLLQQVLREALRR
jgi:restriction endonuclease S subunit